ncbi:hypothetical protein ACG873_22895 [Mesorhizobium sp. AaZ16]
MKAMVDMSSARAGALSGLASAGRILVIVCSVERHGRLPRWFAKTKKLPAKFSRPFIRDREYLIGSFAWGARHWTPVSWPEGPAIGKAGSVPTLRQQEKSIRNNHLTAPVRIGQVLPLDRILIIPNPSSHSFCAVHKKCAVPDQPISSVFWLAI